MPVLIVAFPPYSLFCVFAIAIIFHSDQNFSKSRVATVSSIPELARRCVGALPRPANIQDWPATVRLLPHRSRRWHALHRKSTPHLEWLDLWRGARFPGVVGRPGLRR